MEEHIDKEYLLRELEFCNHDIIRLEFKKYNTGRTPHIGEMRKLLYSKSLDMVHTGVIYDLPLFYLRSLMGQTPTQSIMIRVHDLFAKILNGEVDDIGWDQILDAIYVKQHTFFKATRLKKTIAGMETLIDILRNHKPNK